LRQEGLTNEVHKMEAILKEQNQTKKDFREDL